MESKARARLRAAGDAPRDVVLAGPQLRREVELRRLVGLSRGRARPPVRQHVVQGALRGGVQEEAVLVHLRQELQNGVAQGATNGDELVGADAGIGVAAEAQLLAQGLWVVGGQRRADVDMPAQGGGMNA